MDIASGGRLKSPQEFFEELHKIVENTSGLSGIPLGLLTSEVGVFGYSTIYKQVFFPHRILSPNK